MSRVTKIQQNNSEDVYDFGVSFDNVTYDIKESDGQGGTRITGRFSLTDLYNYLKDFFGNNNSTFVMYSNSKPADDRIKIWYDTTEISSQSE